MDIEMSGLILALCAGIWTEHILSLGRRFQLAYGKQRTRG